MMATLAPLLCMPKAFIGPVQSLSQSAERQSDVILATVLAGIVNMGVAWYLIPAHGAAKVSPMPSSRRWRRLFRWLLPLWAGTQRR
jgi:hypothetical protein